MIDASGFLRAADGFGLVEKFLTAASSARDGSAQAMAAATARSANLRTGCLRNGKWVLPVIRERAASISSRSAGKGKKPYNPRMDEIEATVAGPVAAGAVFSPRHGQPAPLVILLHGAAELRNG